MKGFTPNLRHVPPPPPESFPPPFAARCRDAKGPDRRLSLKRRVDLSDAGPVIVSDLVAANIPTGLV